MTIVRLVLFVILLFSARVSFADGDGSGFASPIPLPALNTLSVNYCVEKVLKQGTAANTWDVNGATLVDLGIFHIHDGIEHANTGDACATKCAGAAREAHLPLGLATCKADVDGKPFANDWKGRKAKAEKMLGCAKVVVSFAVCLDGTAVSLNLGTIYNTLGDRVCLNWGGPTGSHAGDQGMVQWIHYRGYCGSLTKDAAKITVTNEAGKLHMSPTAEPVATDLRDRPYCGYEGNGCSECAFRHQRCCQPVSDPWWYSQNQQNPNGGCDYVYDTLTCVNGRCVPPPPEPPPNGLCLLGGADCYSCLALAGCAWENGSCVEEESSMCTTVFTAAECEADEPEEPPIYPDAGISLPDAGEYAWDAGEYESDAGEYEWDGGEYVWDAGEYGSDAGVYSDCSAFGGWSCYSCLGYSGCVWDQGYCVSAGEATPYAVSTWEGCYTPYSPDAGVSAPDAEYDYPDSGVNWECGAFGNTSCYSCLGYSGCVWDQGYCVSAGQATPNAVSTWEACYMLYSPDAGVSAPDAEFSMPDATTDTSTTAI